jgi:hypothetical protein
MKQARGKLEVFMQHMVVKYDGMITEDGDRISIFDEKTEQAHSYPSQWCHIIWDKIIVPKKIETRSCIQIGCYKDSNLLTEYCSSHSLYGSRY